VGGTRIGRDERRVACTAFLSWATIDSASATLEGADQVRFTIESTRDGYSSSF